MGRGAGRAGLWSSHMHIVAVPHVPWLVSARAVVTDCRLVEMVAIFHWPACHCWQPRLSDLCLCRSHYTARRLLHRVQTHAHIYTLAGVRMSYISGAAGWREGGNGCRKGGRGWGGCDCSCCIGWSWFSFFCLQRLRDESQTLYLPASHTVLWLWATAFTSI